MDKKSKEAESEPIVYEIPGEPAVVINGIPKRNLDCNTLVPSKPDKENDESKKDKGCGEWLEEREVQKLFAGKYYSGRVMKYDKETGWYRVKYSDGDSEDLDWLELEQVLCPVDISVPLKTVALKVLDKDSKAERLQLVVPPGSESEIQKVKNTGSNGKKKKKKGKAL